MLDVACTRGPLTILSKHLSCDVCRKLFVKLFPRLNISLDMLFQYSTISMCL